MGRALRVGITGKFGSGKSTVSQVYRDQGIMVIDSDNLAKELMTSDAELRNQLTAILGPEAYTGEDLNREFVAERIFSDRQTKLNVESVVHPAVYRAIEQEFERAKPGDVVAVESALIFQTFLWRTFDYIVIVDSSDEAIQHRSEAAGRFTAETVRARLAEQDYHQDYVTGADFAISNNDSVDALRSRALMTATILKALAKQQLPDIPLRSKQEDEDDDEEPELDPTDDTTNTTIH